MNAKRDPRYLITILDVRQWEVAPDDSDLEAGRSKDTGFYATGRFPVVPRVGEYIRMTAGCAFNPIDKNLTFKVVAVTHEISNGGIDDLDPDSGFHTPEAVFTEVVVEPVFDEETYEALWTALNNRRQKARKEGS